MTRQLDIASDLWRLLARQAQADLYGLDVALAARRHNATPSFGALARLPITRTATQRTAEVRALARDLAWLRNLGVVSLDDLVAEFSRRARRGEITPERPKEHGLLLGSLARPLWPQQVELGGLEHALGSCAVHAAGGGAQGGLHLAGQIRWPPTAPLHRKRGISRPALLFIVIYEVQLLSQSLLQ
ncbi:hypothetical protein DGo_PB0081 (plasmid) [Deinococcus gobiensis I-0]|uniref:Uncharacterized protein n=1 Tax=Deinococcus gobiensis (strain DSM 21396 / JCM 16679 / CGMCC 1.7299 / I-0) TaxID=745776 RepID=H8H1F3_DEIGI|nr:hypothetical protein DGo_PB0081 [Deinococcus gobiensis I-0]